MRKDVVLLRLQAVDVLGQGKDASTHPRLRVTRSKLALAQGFRIAIAPDRHIARAVCLHQLPAVNKFVNPLKWEHTIVFLG